MIRTKSILGSILALVGVTAAGLTAHADDSFQTFNFTDTGAPYNITFNLFNSNLGILNSVTYEFDATSTANFNVVNLGPAVAGVDLKSTVHVDVFGPIAGTHYLSEDVIAEDTNFSIGNGAPFAFKNDNGVVGNLTDSASVALGDLSAYKAPGGGPSVGQLSILIAAPDSVIFNNPGPLAIIGGSTSTAGTLKLHYNFTRVVTPEPGTWALLAASSVMGVAGIRRRRRSA